MCPMNNDFGSEAEIKRIIRNAADEFKVDANLLLSIARAESNLNPQALGPMLHVMAKPQRAQGLFQFMYDTFEEMRAKIKPKLDDASIMNPVSSARCAAFYVSRLLKQFKQNPVFVLAAYNWGMGNVERKIVVKRTIKNWLFKVVGEEYFMDSNAIFRMPGETINYIRKINSFYNEYTGHDLA